jgi:lipoate-protein ligase A
VNDGVEELYDYDVLRGLEHPTMLSVRVAEPTIVLGSSQSVELLRDGGSGRPVRRRRGGGGAVLIHPDDAWVDWWLPATDERWVFDVHAASALAGSWWRDAALSCCCWGCVLAQLERESTVRAGASASAMGDAYAAV